MVRFWNLGFCAAASFVLFNAYLINISLADSLSNNGENSWGYLDLCSVQEYSITQWGFCTFDKRSVRYERLPGSCIGPLHFEVDISCDCQLQDYEPILADPNCGIVNLESDETATTTLIGWIPRPEVRCVPNLEIGKMLNSTVTQANGSVIVNCPCNEKLISSYTTQCDLSSRLRSIVYYWSRPCMQTSQLRLPAPRFVSCDLTCGDGYYFDSIEATCYQCPAGTRSSSGLSYSEPWNKLPKDFSTECQGADCDSWGPHGNFISSGLNVNKKNIRSILNFSFEVEKPSANFSVTYRMASQPGLDIFKIKIRGRTALVDTSITPVWKTFSVVMEDFADTCPWNLQWFKSSKKYDYCILRTKLSPSSSKMAEKLQENMRAYQFDHILIPEQSGCEWWAFERPETWKSTDRVLVFVPIGDCSIAKKISFAQRSKMDALIIVTEQFLHQIELPDPGEIPAFPVYVIRQDMAIFMSEIGSRQTPWFEYKSISDMGVIPVEFIYERNDETLQNVGHVLVKDIHVTNPKNGLEASKCIACPPGLISSKGSVSCTKCPINTFNSEYNSAECKPCPPGYISEEGSFSCVKAHECSMEDFFVIENSPCRISTSATRGLERGVSFLKVSPARCFDTDKSVKIPPPKFLPCATCPEGHILEFSGTCTPCENLTSPNDLKDRCMSCPPKKAVYPVRTYNGFQSLKGSFPTSWITKCIACDTVGWKFLPYHSGYGDNSDMLTGIGVGGELFTEGIATFEIPFELIYRGDLNFVYSYNELPSVYADNLSVVTFEIINPLEETPIAVKLDNAAHNLGTYFTPKLQPGQYVARWTYLKDPSRIVDTKTELTDRQSNSGFILHSIVIFGEKTGSGSCTECMVGYDCETGILTPCPVGTYSNASTDYKCIKCPADSVSEKASSICVGCPTDTAPSEDRRVCVMKKSQREISPLEAHEYLWNDLPPLFGPVLIDLDQDASEVSAVANRKSEQTIYVLNKYADPAYRSIVSRLPLDFSKDIYGPSVYVISYDSVMRIGVSKGIELSEWMGTNSTDHLTDNDIHNATLPFTDVLYEANKPCEVKNHNYTASVRFHCNTTHYDPWISKAYYEPNKCRYNIHVHFQQACPTCLRLQYLRSSSPCINGMHDVYTRYVSLDNYTCYDKRVLAIPEYTREFCNISDQIETQASYITIFSFALIVLLCFLCFFALGIYRKHQQLYETYHSIPGVLRGENEEMKNINAHVPPGVVID